MDKPLGKPACCSLTTKGKLITAIKTASKRGTSSDAASFIPAIMITSAAVIITARAVEEKDVAILTLSLRASVAFWQVAEKAPVSAIRR